MKTRKRQEIYEIKTTDTPDKMNFGKYKGLQRAVTEKTKKSDGKIGKSLKLNCLS